MKRIISPTLKSVLNHNTTTYLWLIGICILAYGLLIPKLGFYWDDLPYLFLYRTLGVSEFPNFVASDRPFSAWIFMITTSLFSYQAIWYHLLALILRIVCVILFFHLAELIWPKQKNRNVITAAIFAIYPGFLQQPIALIYIHHFSVLTLFLLSLNLMIINAKSEKMNSLAFLISILASFHLFSIENFALLELLRPILLWFISNEKFSNIKSRLRFIFLIWLPYLLVLCSFLVWRIFIFKFPTYKPEILLDPGQPLVHGIHQVLNRIPADFFTVMVDAWLKPFFLPTISEFGTLATYIFWILLTISLIINFGVLQYLTYSQKAKNHQSQIKKQTKNYYKERLFLGVCAFFLAASIGWILDLPLEIEFAWDRMTIGFIPAVALIAGAIYGFFEKRKMAVNLIFAVIISVAIGSHFENSMSYKRDSEKFNDFFQQLTWRAPHLKEGTILLSSETGLKYFSDNSLTAPLNMIYAPHADSETLKYLFYHTDVRLGTKLPSFDKNLEIYQQYRNFYFKGNTSNVLTLKYDPPGCLQIMDSRFSNSTVLPNLSSKQVDEISLSNLDQIIYSELPSENILPNGIFSPLQGRTWCYYFEKADLARQFKQYDKGVALGDEAMENNLSPRIGTEWLPFIESYIYTSNWPKAGYIAKLMITKDENLRPGLCHTLLRIKKQPDFTENNEIDELLRDYNCLQKTQ